MSLIIKESCLKFVLLVILFFVLIFSLTYKNEEVNKDFKVYWNIPTFRCKKYGLHFDNLTAQFNITTNDEDSFNGNKILTLYDPGEFPVILKNSNGCLSYINAGIPQEANLQKHIHKLKNDINKLIPNKDFDGIAVIDFESWRPVFRQNFGTLQTYKDVSYEVERKKHRHFTEAEILEKAEDRFEEGARKFMEETLKIAVKERPLAIWGFYSYPECFYVNEQRGIPVCSNNMIEDNDKIQWLWNVSDALFPSLYLSKDKSFKSLKGKVLEAQRLSSMNQSKQKIFAHVWYKYKDSDTFLSKNDLYTALNFLSKSGIDGSIVWGSNSDTYTEEHCYQIWNYTQNILGPSLMNIFLKKR